MGRPSASQYTDTPPVQAEGVGLLVKPRQAPDPVLVPFPGSLLQGLVDQGSAYLVKQASWGNALSARLAYDGSDDEGGLAGVPPLAASLVRPPPGLELPVLKPRAVRRRERGQPRLCCTFIFAPEASQATGFRLVHRLIGRGGGNVKVIANASNGKVRIRGRGSGHREGPHGCEAELPLQVVLSCATEEDFLHGRDLLAGFLDHISAQFRRFCLQTKIPPPPRFYHIVPNCSGSAGKEHTEPATSMTLRRCASLMQPEVRNQQAKYLQGRDMDVRKATGLKVTEAF